MPMIPNDFYVYNLTFAGLAAAGNALQVLNFDASSDFTWLYGTYRCENAAASTGITATTRIYPLATLLITPADTSSQFMNAAVPVTSMFGNGENPFVMPFPRIIPANSSVTFQVFSQDTALAYNLYLQLIGRKKYHGV